MTTTEAPKIRFDIFYKHDDLTRLLFEYAQAFPDAGRDPLDRQELRRARHLGGDDHQRRDRLGRGQAGVLDRRQHPRRRADRIDGGAVLPERAAHQVRQRCRDHAAARHARRLPLPAPQSRRRRARARRPAAPHPLVDAPLSLRRGAGRRPHRRGHRRRRQDPLHARRRSARHVEEVRAGPAPDGGAPARRVRRRVLPPDARGPDQELRRPDDQGQLRPRRARPQSQFPVGLAPGARAGRRRRLSDQRARGEGDGRLHRRATRTSARRSAITPTAA